MACRCRATLHFTCTPTLHLPPWHPWMSILALFVLLTSRRQQRSRTTARRTRARARSSPSRACRLHRLLPLQDPLPSSRCSSVLPNHQPRPRPRDLPLHRQRRHLRLHPPGRPLQQPGPRPRRRHRPGPSPPWPQQLLPRQTLGSGGQGLNRPPPRPLPGHPPPPRCSRGQALLLTPDPSSRPHQRRAQHSGWDLRQALHPPPLLDRAPPPCMRPRDRHSAQSRCSPQVPVVAWAPSGQML